MGSRLVAAATTDPAARLRVHRRSSSVVGKRPTTKLATASTQQTWVCVHRMQPTPRCYLDSDSRNTNAVVSSTVRVQCQPFTDVVAPVPIPLSTVYQRMSFSGNRGSFRWAVQQHSYRRMINPAETCGSRDYSDGRPTSSTLHTSRVHSDGCPTAFMFMFVNRACSDGRSTVLSFGGKEQARTMISVNEFRGIWQVLLSAEKELEPLCDSLCWKCGSCCWDSPKCRSRLYLRQWGEWQWVPTQTDFFCRPPLLGTVEVRHDERVAPIF